MKMRTAVVLAAALSVMAWIPNSSSAQQFTGGLRGAVRDANGIIPGVTVTLTNEGTAITREAATNEQGQYNFSAVTPGTYTVKAALQGFKTYENKGIRIGTQMFITLDVLLEVGQIEESVTVTGQSPLIETSNASVGESLGRELLESLPAPGRAAFLIAITVPTVNPVGDPQFNRQQDQTNASLISLGGGGVRANNYTVDGVPITDLTGRAVLNPSIEAIDEVKVQVHTYDADMGRTGGGVFNTTAKAGTNQFHGTGFYQSRPVWGQSENYFNAVAGLTKEQSGLANGRFHTYGGGVGGPIWKNRTFFWTSAEGYRSTTTRNLQEIWPSARQRTGDFSTSTIGGQPVRIFNPWCRSGAASAQCPATGTGSIATGGEFTGGIIPRTHPAASQVGFNLLGAYPMVDTRGNPIGSNQDNQVNVSTTGSIRDRADMWSIKAEHKFTDRSSLSGFYVYNTTTEPATESMPASHDYMDGAYDLLERRPHLLVFNNTNILNDTTILSLRYGWTTWMDQNERVPFPAGLASLGFSPNYVNAIHPDGRDLFPDLNFDEVRDVGLSGGTRRRWKGPYSINAALSKLSGNHQFKLGADLRRLGIATTTFNENAGDFTFTRAFSSRPGVANSGHELASALLGLPRLGRVDFARGELEWYARYWGGYVQDDWRVSSNFTLNYGVRFEHEDALREIENRQTVAFDRSVVNPIDAQVNKTGTLLQGRAITGGLIYAGVNGAPEEQGNLPAVTVSPRVGIAWTPTARTVIRAGYGLFSAPWQYSATEHGQIGFTRTTNMNQSADTTEVPLTTLDNPFPNGLQQPLGSSLGLLTGIGSNITFVDQDRTWSKVHQYSIDAQRELGGNVAVTVGYTGATGRDLGYGGSNNTLVNINQIDPAVARAAFPGPNGSWDAAALRQSIPNPFFGLASAGEFATRATIPRGQLLRPFPQFGDVFVSEMTNGGRRQFHAATVKLDKRTGSGWWGGRFNYTWSSTKDNQFGQTSFYSRSLNLPQDNYDLDAEYGPSNFDSPHRIILSPIVRIPSPGSGLARTLLGDWMATAIVELVSGAPLNATISGGTSDANLGLLGGRQRPNVAGDPNVDASDADRVASADHTSAAWFNRAAFNSPGPGQYGSAPRTLGDARWQFRKTIDLSVSKNVRFSGGQAGEIRLEVLNLTNTGKFAAGALNTDSIDLTSFSRVTAQASFMRIWQFTFRYRF
jgi:trimeric autotransporter adhesin